MKKHMILPALWLCLFASASAQEQQAGAGDVAAKLSNPVSSMISLPFQNNTDVGISSNHGWRNTLNIQPVVPLKLSDNLNLIARWVQPIISQQDIADGNNSSDAGLGDAVVSGFISPTHSKGLTWGAGPVFLVPVATNDVFASKKFGIGPTIVALKQTHGWTIGLLANQIWSVAGSDDKPDVNQLFLQPFIGHNWKSGAGITFTAEMTEDWQNDFTTAFLHLMFSGVTKFGSQTVSLQIGPRLQVAAPNGNKSDFGLRAAIILVFPK